MGAAASGPCCRSRSPSPLPPPPPPLAAADSRWWSVRRHTEGTQRSNRRLNRWLVVVVVSGATEGQFIIVELERTRQCRGVVLVVADRICSAKCSRIYAQPVQNSLGSAHGHCRPAGRGTRDLAKAVFEDPPPGVAVRAAIPQASIYEKAHDLGPAIHDETDLSGDARRPDWATGAGPSLPVASGVCKLRRDSSGG